MSDLAELHCADCGEAIAYFIDSSGAPHYHFYYCYSCAHKIDDDEE